MGRRRVAAEPWKRVTSTPANALPGNLFPARMSAERMSIVGLSQYGRTMTHADPAINTLPGDYTVQEPPERMLPWRSAVLDRVSAKRASAGFIEEVLARPGTRIMVLAKRETLIHDGGIVLLGPDSMPAGRPLIYLGSALPGSSLEEGTDVVLVLLEERTEPGLIPGAPAGAGWAGFREVAADLSAADAAIFIEASAISNWHETHRHCPRCGTATDIEQSGWVRRCPQDKSEHFPRTDPAIIVTVVGPDGRVLLGGSGAWDAKRYSTLAGFVEPGESLEQAVVREVAEEVGVRVHTPQYLGSQSWPFPASLMLGFTARTEDREAVPDGVEVTRARWFDRDELQAAVTSGEILISTPASIARALIEHWYGGPIVDRPLED